jgi:23S rRNA (pseudouridine1915-N3)-methyltransferase
MRIHLIAVGTRMPGWVAQGYHEYARRLPPQCALELREVEAARQSANASPARRRAEEGERLLAAVPARAAVVALDETGESWATADLAERLRDWLGSGADLGLLVGGADGLSPACLGRAERRWSLSALTLPHMLVRVVVAEQIYRAWSLLSGHPYHRAATRASDPARGRRPGPAR